MIQEIPSACKDFRLSEHLSALRTTEENDRMSHIAVRVCMDILKQYRWTLALLAILFGAIFVRTYSLDEWLYFKMDQARDALLITDILEKGPSSLPLLGPRVGAVDLKSGFLRLGPIYYYFQYLAGVLFHSSEPSVFAYPDVFFSIAAIPLLYAFARLYFEKRHALMVTAMYAFSFLVIQYSRFAWNPNSLQFFILLSFYGLLRFLNEERFSSKCRWLALWAVGSAIGSQLHFFGFFSLLGISGLLVLFHGRIWKRASWQTMFRRESLRQFAVFSAIIVGIFAFFYTPVVLSDSLRGGENTRNFFEALGSKAEKKPLIDKLQKTVTENLKYSCLLLTSECYAGDVDSQENVPFIALTATIFLVGAILAVRGLRRENNTLRRDFLALTLLWVGVFVVLTEPVSFQLRPRFYIVIFAIPFLFLGFLYEFLESRFSKRVFPISILLTLGIVALNAHGTFLWFREQAKAQTKAISVKRTLILKTKDGVTLGQLRGAADWAYARMKPGNTLYYYVKPEHQRPIKFLLRSHGDRLLRVESLTINEDPTAQFFAITPAKNGKKDVAKKLKLSEGDFIILDSKQFGELLVSEINFPNRHTSDTFKYKENKEVDREGESDRSYWKDILPALSGEE